MRRLAANDGEPSEYAVANERLDAFSDSGDVLFGDGAALDLLHVGKRVEGER